MSVTPLGRYVRCAKGRQGDFTRAEYIETAVCAIAFGDWPID